MPWEHGSTTGYARGCRCDLCTAAHTVAARDYNARHPDKRKAHEAKVNKRRLAERRFNPRRRQDRLDAAAERRRKRLERRGEE